MQTAIDDVRMFLDEHRGDDGVKELLQEFAAPAEESVREYLEDTEDGRRLFQRLTDSTVSRAIATYTEKTLPRLVEERYHEDHPPDTPEQTELRELRERLADAERERSRVEMTVRATNMARDMGLPDDLAGYFADQDEERTRDNLSRLETAISHEVDRRTAERFKTHGRVPLETGGAGTDSLELMHHRAVERGDIVEAVRLKHRMYNDNH